MVYTTYTQQRVLYYHFHGMRPNQISKLLQQEGIATTRRGISDLLKKYATTGAIARIPGSGRPTKVTAEMRKIVEEKMQNDDETTAIQMFCHLQEKGFSISRRTVLRWRTSLGWTFRGSAYCQLIRDKNKEKRLIWAQKNIKLNFENVIWSDETTIQLETHRRFACRKRGQPPKNKPR